MSVRFSLKSGQTLWCWGQLVWQTLWCWGGGNSISQKCGISHVIIFYCTLTVQ